MWPWILGSAALGGLQSYAQSGGDIGKTLSGAAIGGGLGALGPVATRMAGGLLAGTPLATKLAPSVYKAGQLFAGGEGASSLINPLAQQVAGRGLIAKGAAGLAGLGLTAAIPTVAAGLSGIPGQAANAALRTGGSVAGAAQAQSGFGTPPVPNPEDILRAYNIDPSYLEKYNQGLQVSAQDQLDPTKGYFGARFGSELEAATQARNIQRLAGALAPWTAAAKNQDMQRQAAMKAFGTNLNLQAQNTLNSLENVRSMGQTAALQAGQALINQYQYS